MASNLFYCANVGSSVRTVAEELALAARPYSVLAFQETGLRAEEDARRFCRRFFPDHRLLLFIALDAQGTGCIMLAHRHTKVLAADQRSAARHRLQWIEVVVKGRVVRLCSLYVPAVSTGMAFDHSLLRLGLSRRCAVVAGDLNARSAELGCRSTNAHGRELAAFLLDQATDTAVALTDPTTPSFVHRSTPFADTVDWAIATPSASGFLNASFGEGFGSDHLPILIRPDVPTPQPYRTSPVPRWRTSTVRDWTPFQAAVQRELSELASELRDRPPSSPEEVDEAATRLEEGLQRAADATLARSRPLSDRGAAPLPWLLVQLARERNRLRRRVAQSAEGQLRSELRRQLRHACSTFKAELEKHRRQLLADRTQLFAAGPRRGTDFWTAIRRWFRAQKEDPPPLAVDGTTATTPAERASVLADHLERALGGPVDASFDEAFRVETEARIAADADLRPLPSLPPDEETPADAEEPTRPVTTADVRREMRRLASGKAPGFDGLSSDMVRRCPPLVDSVLAAVFTSAYRLGHFPPCWRRSVVRMLPKEGKALTAPADFRPIALCSVVGKLAERIFAQRLLSLCLLRGLLPPEQSAFRPGRDTCDQLALLTQRVGQSLNGGLATTLIALDANKAYDSVWHAGLLQCLDELQLSCPTRRWVAAFLRDRRAAVLEDGHLSRTFRTAAGVPQGSPLSPLLYILYTAEMPLPRGPLQGASVYADDVALWASGPTPTAALSRLRPALDRAVRWGQRWRIAFNPSKTQLGFFTRRSHYPGMGAAAQLMGRTVPWSRTVDLLGVRLDRRLSFCAHVEHLGRRLGPRIADLRRWTWAYRAVPRWVGGLLVKTLLRPAYTYAAPVLQLACPTARDDLRRLDNRCLRAGLRRGMLFPVAGLHADASAAYLDPHLRELSRRFLLRLARTRHDRLLGAFNAWTRRHPERAWRGTLLERIYEIQAPGERACVRQALADLAITPQAADHHHPGGGRSRAAPAANLTLGRSPFDG
jgi:hypothetical protein